MMENLTDGDKPPLPSRNVASLVAILFKIAARRKQQQQAKTSPTAPYSHTLATTDSGYGDETPRFKGRLPSEVQLSELTAEFRALNVVTERRERETLRETQSYPSGILCSKTLKPEDKEFQTLAPSQMVFHRNEASRFATEPSSMDQRHSTTAEEASHSMNWPTAEHFRDPSLSLLTQWWTQHVFGEIPQTLAGREAEQGFPWSGVRHSDVDPAPTDKPLWASLAAVSPAQQKQVLGERLYPLVQSLQPGLAGKITGMLLQLDNAELLCLLQSPELLKGRVQGAASQLLTHTLTVPLSVDMLRLWTPHQQKQIVGERLFPAVQRLQPDLAGKITGMLLEMDNTELFHLLQSPVMLKDKVQEAVTQLRAHMMTGHLSVDMLTWWSPQQQKEILGERLYPLVERLQSGFAGKITGMLLEMDNAELLRLLQSPVMLNSKVQEAVVVLQASLREEDLKTDILRLFSPPHQKQILGERVYPFIHGLQPELAGKITGMLLEMDNTALVSLLQSPDVLKDKVQEATVVLQRYLEADKEAGVKIHDWSRIKGPAYVGSTPRDANLSITEPTTTTTEQCSQGVSMPRTSGNNAHEKDSHDTPQFDSTLLKPDHDGSHSGEGGSDDVSLLLQTRKDGQVEPAQNGSSRSGGNDTMQYRQPMVMAQSVLGTGLPPGMIGPQWMLMPQTSVSGASAGFIGQPLGWTPGLTRPEAVLSLGAQRQKNNVYKKMSKAAVPLLDFLLTLQDAGITTRSADSAGTPDEADQASKEEVTVERRRQTDTTQNATGCQTGNHGARQAHDEITQQDTSDDVTLEVREDTSSPCQETDDVIVSKEDDVKLTQDDRQTSGGSEANPAQDATVVGEKVHTSEVPVAGHPMYPAEAQYHQTATQPWSVYGVSVTQGTVAPQWVLMPQMAGPGVSAGLINQPLGWTSGYTGSQAALSLWAQRQILWQHLYHFILRLEPGLAANITGMLLQLDNTELLRLLQSPELLKDRVQEAVAKLQAGLKGDAKGFSSGEISTDQCSSTAADLSNDDGQDTTVVQAVDTGDREHLAKQLEEAQNQDADTDDVCLTYESAQLRKVSDQRMTTLGDAVYFQGQRADADDVHMTHDDTIRREGSDVEKTALYDASHLRQREKSQTGVSESVSMTYTDDGASGEHVHRSSTVDVMDAALPLQRETLCDARTLCQQMLRERLYREVSRMYPSMADHIMTHLGALDSGQTLAMLESQELLTDNIMKAFARTQSDEGSEPSENTAEYLKLGL